ALPHRLGRARRQGRLRTPGEAGVALRNAHARRGRRTPAAARAALLHVRVGPDNVMIEDNTAANNLYNHVHLMSEEPVAAGEWYAKEFGFPRRAQPASKAPRYFNGHQIGPTSRFNIDNVNVPIFPMELLRQLFPAEWEGRKHAESPKGHALD